MFNYSVVLTIFFCFGLGSVYAGGEEVYMSILSSHKHRIGASDNPLVGLFVSSDQGRSWEHKGWREYIRTFYTEAGADGTIWSACGNGVLRSTDAGASWVITTGWDVTEVLKVKVDPFDPAVVYAATAYGVIKTADKGAHWTKITNGFHWKFSADVCPDRSIRGTLLAASEEGVYRTTDGGGQWNRSGLDGKGIRVIVQDPHNAQVFWVGTEEDGVLRSTDSGLTWTQKSSGLNHRTVYAIAVDPSNSSTIYVGTYGGGVYRTRDGGQNWEQRSKGLEVLDVHSLVVLPSDPRIVLAGTLNGGLYRSTDSGDSWVFYAQEEAQVWGLSVR